MPEGVAKSQPKEGVDVNHVIKLIQDAVQAREHTILRLKKHKGGWEGWLQVEIGAQLRKDLKQHGYTVEREVQIFANQDQPDGRTISHLHLLTPPPTPPLTQTERESHTHLQTQESDMETDNSMSLSDSESQDPSSHNKASDDEDSDSDYEQLPEDPEEAKIEALEHSANAADEAKLNYQECDLYLKPLDAKNESLRVFAIELKVDNALVKKDSTEHGPAHESFTEQPPAKKKKIPETYLEKGFKDDIRKLSQRLKVNWPSVSRLAIAITSQQQIDQTNISKVIDPTIAKINRVAMKSNEKSTPAQTKTEELTMLWAEVLPHLETKEEEATEKIHTAQDGHPVSSASPHKQTMTSSPRYVVKSLL